jgi:hypothetical protein
VILLSANLSFIKLSGIRPSRHQRKYCALNESSIIVDLLTASILPMGKSIFISLLISATSYYYRKYPTKDVDEKQTLYLLLSHQKLTIKLST